MKLLSLATFLTVLLLTFSGCVGTSPKPSDKPVIDTSLPTIKLSETGIFKDMKAIGFEWKSIDDSRVKGIYVYRKSFGKKDAKYKFIDTIENRFVTHYIDENVEPGSKYGYYFKTFTLHSESQASKKSTVTTLPVLGSVSWIHAVENMPRSAKIIWRPHNNQLVQRYVLERKTLKENKWKKINTISGRLSAEYIDSELKDEFVYKYRLKALTYNDILSKPSKEVEVLTKPLPNAIENIVATNTLAKRIELTWNKTEIKDFSHYNIYRASKSDSSYNKIAQTKTIKYVDTIDEDGKKYFYRISIVDNDGLESMSDRKSTNGQTLAKPTTPSSVKIQMIGKRMHLQWNSNDLRVKSFIVVKKVKLSWLNTKNYAFEDITGNNFVDSDIAPQTTYSYEVYSVDRFGIKSDPSVEVQYTTAKNEGIKPVVKIHNPVPIKNEVEIIKKKKIENVIKPLEMFDVSTL